MLYLCKRKITTTTTKLQKTNKNPNVSPICFYPIMTHIFSNIKVSEDIKTKQYTLMYYYASWQPHGLGFCAENDKEAIFDADQMFHESEILPLWGYGVALFCGNRKVKEYIPVSHDPESMKYLRIARELNPAKFEAKYMNI